MTLSYFMMIFLYASSNSKFLKFQETLRVQIHANCRIRRVYFSDRLYSEEELPAEFKLYLPVQQKQHAGMSLLQHHQQREQQAQQSNSKPETGGENALEMANAEV